MAERLRERRGEIEQLGLTRIHAISEPGESARPSYGQGLRAAVSAALDYGVEALESGEERPPPVPGILLSQARLAAREGIGLETVMRQYFAGYALLSDVLIEEAEKCGLAHPKAIQQLIRAQATLCDRVMAAVAEHYSREAQSRLGSAEQRRAERVERLLAGEPLDTSGLSYDFETTHVGAIAAGEGAGEAIRGLARALECRLLMVERAQTTWAWFGSRRLERERVHTLVASTWPEGIALSLGEPARDLAGWRLTHRQAKAALPIALRSDPPIARYGDVALLASIIHDDLLATSLEQLYLRPLEEERDGGRVARETLRAYFAADRNVSSAAAVLGVTRKTVRSRLHAIEECLDRSLSLCSAELEAALRMEEIHEREGTEAMTRFGTSLPAV